LYLNMKKFILPLFLLAVIILEACIPSNRSSRELTTNNLEVSVNSIDGPLTADTVIHFDLWIPRAGLIPPPVPPLHFEVASSMEAAFNAALANNSITPVFRVAPISAVANPTDLTIVTGAVQNGRADIFITAGSIQPVVDSFYDIHWQIDETHKGSFRLDIVNTTVTSMPLTMTSEQANATFLGSNRLSIANNAGSIELLLLFNNLAYSELSLKEREYADHILSNGLVSMTYSSTVGTNGTETQWGTPPPANIFNIIMPAQLESIREGVIVFYFDRMGTNVNTPLRPRFNFSAEPLAAAGATAPFAQPSIFMEPS
jgi:hypothetical protein